jgi:hypothetical protein
LRATPNDPSEALGSGNYAIPAFFAAVHEPGMHIKANVRRPLCGLESAFAAPPESATSEFMGSRPNLSVLPVHGIEWSDLGEPLRVMTVLSRLGIHPDWAAA